MREELATIKILSALKHKELANPGELVGDTGLPRYLILAAFQILEELGYVRLVYSRGSHKIYSITEKGEEALKQLSIAENTSKQTGLEEASS